MSENKKGYIKLARKSINSDIWDKPPLYWKVWCYILMKANYAENNLDRGEAFLTIKELREACTYYIGYRKVTPSIKQIRGILDYLRKPHEGSTNGAMIGITKVTHGMLVKVHNYDKYQSFENYEGKDEILTNGLRRSFEGHNNKKKEKKEKKEINNYIYNTYKKSVPTYMIDNLTGGELATKEQLEDINKLIERIKND